MKHDDRPIETATLGGPGYVRRTIPKHVEAGLRSIRSGGAQCACGQAATHLQPRDGRVQFTCADHAGRAVSHETARRQAKIIEMRRWAAEAGR